MKKPLYKHLYAQVLFAIVCGVILGHFWPETGEAMKPLGDAFIKLIKMIIAPIIFCTVVTGIAGMEDMKFVALICNSVASSIAYGVRATSPSQSNAVQCRATQNTGATFLYTANHG
jgi:aerobic C4-dicarboxylate transport protein